MCLCSHSLLSDCQIVSSTYIFCWTTDYLFATFSKTYRLSCAKELSKIWLYKIFAFASAWRNEFVQLFSSINSEMRSEDPYGISHIQVLSLPGVFETYVTKHTFYTSCRQCVQIKKNKNREALWLDKNDCSPYTTDLIRPDPGKGQCLHINH